jgi:hypothetical protein
MGHLSRCIEEWETVKALKMMMGRASAFRTVSDRAAWLDHKSGHHLISRPAHRDRAAMNGAQLVMAHGDSSGLMGEYVRYYHEDRTHLALAKGTPAGREAVSDSGAGSRVVAMPRLGGLHRRYDLAA